MIARTTTKTPPRLSPRPSSGFLDWIALMASVVRERHRLAQLDPHELRDIGLTEADVKAELRRPIWDISPNRRP